MNGISLYPNSGYNYTSPYAAVSTAAGNTASGNSSLTGVEESNGNPPRQNARPVRNANIRTALMKWFPLSQPPIFHRKPLLQQFVLMSRSMSAMHTGKQQRAVVRSSAPTSPCSVPSVRNAAEAMSREVRLQRRFLIRMSRQILMPGIRNQLMPLCSSAAIWIWLYNPCLFSSIPVTASYP